MNVLTGFRVVQFGPGLAAAVCGRLLADAGADVARIEPDRTSPLGEALNRGPDALCALADADLIICEGSPAALRAGNRDPETLRRLNPRAALVLISPAGNMTNNGSPILPRQRMSRASRCGNLWNS
jgi:hypothetical protein